MLRWMEVLHLSDEQLAAFDVAEVNLSCAEGLPGAETIDHAECINRLNHFAQCSSHYTERRIDIFRMQPAAYNHSEALFRIICMMTLLWRQLGIRYNPAKIPVNVPMDTADTFIHGALLGEGGTCATLPIVYAAVGRRLNYPLKLVTCANHLFVRWEEAGGERFNVEVNDTGTSTPPDEYYRCGQYAVSVQTEKAFCFLQSLTPRTELASFLAQRGCLLLDKGMDREAVEAFSWAARLAPASKGYQNCVRAAWNRWKKSGGQACGSKRLRKSGLELFA